MAEDLTGKRLGYYRVDGVLGRGGMSVLYRATDTRLSRSVALKVISEQFTGDPEFRERFVDEARNTAAIDHSNVVPLYDFGELNGVLYIAMRLVDGPDLASLLKNGPLSPLRTLVLLSQAGEALDMLADRGLVHLDVKPANLLVTTRESAGEHVYLADFGLTRRGATGHRTSGGDFLGSPTFAAPEHLRGEPVDGRTDLYSLACVLFACLTGHPPYQGDVTDVIQGHLHGEIPSASAAVAVPSGIDAVIRRGMAKDPRLRYASCREMMTAARTALMSVTEPARPLVRIRTADQRPAGLSPGHSLPTPTGASTSQGWAGYPGTEPQRIRPPVPVSSTILREEPDGVARWIWPILVGAMLLVLAVGVIMWLAQWS